MEAVAAIGLASSIMAFIDSSWSLISGTKKRLDTAGGDEESSLEDIEDELEVFVEQSAKDYRGTSKANRSIARLANKCKDDLRVLIEVLSGPALSTSHRTIESILRMQLKWPFKKSREIQALKERLRDYRMRIMMSLQLLLQ